MNHTISKTDEYEANRDGIYRHLHVAYRPSGSLNFIAEPLVKKAALALTAYGTANGGASFGSYVKICYTPPR